MASTRTALSAISTCEVASACRRWALNSGVRAHALAKGRQHALRATHIGGRQRNRQAGGERHLINRPGVQGLTRRRAGRHHLPHAHHPVRRNDGVFDLHRARSGAVQADRVPVFDDAKICLGHEQHQVFVLAARRQGTVGAQRHEVRPVHAGGEHPAAGQVQTVAGVAQRAHRREHVREQAVRVVAPQLALQFLANQRAPPVMTAQQHLHPGRRDVVAGRHLRHAYEVRERHSEPASVGRLQHADQPGVRQIRDQIVRQAPVAVGGIGLDGGAFTDAVGGLDQTGELGCGCRSWRAPPSSFRPCNSNSPIAVAAWRPALGLPGSWLRYRHAAEAEMLAHADGQAAVTGADPAPPDPAGRSRRAALRR